ncbi:MAG: class I SAM-dependent methyltransferase [Paracoccaceae bacterium]|nr:MAG: class I SAM-dependent methyltransferase [Paracoccaceae bacterium]
MSNSGYQANDGAAYERFIGRWSRRVADRIAETIPLPGDGPVLDVGCGTGSVTAALAARYPGRALVGVDVAEPYLAFARGRTDQPGVAFQRMDALELDFPDGRFDAAIALIALNFMSDPLRAARQMVRVVRPGGMVVTAAWDFRGGLVYQRLLWDTAAGIDPVAASTRDRIFANPLAKPDGMPDLLRAAGLTDVERRSETVRMDFADFDDYWQPLLGGQGPVGGYVAALEPALRERVAQAVRMAYLSGDTDGPRSLTATAWVVTGRVAK